MRNACLSQPQAALKHLPVLTAVEEQIDRFNINIIFLLYDYFYMIIRKATIFEQT